FDATPISALSPTAIIASSDHHRYPSNSSPSIIVMPTQDEPDEPEREDPDAENIFSTLNAMMGLFMNGSAYSQAMGEMLLDEVESGRRERRKGDASPVAVDASPLPEIAVPGLAGSDWEALDAKKLADTVVAALAECVSLYPKTLGRLATPPDDDSLLRRAEAYGHRLALAYAPLAYLCSPSDQSHDDALKPFIDPVPAAPCPAIAFAAIAGLVFPRAFPLLRRLVSDFIDPSRREAWRAIDVTDVDFAQRMPPAMPASTTKFIEHHWPAASRALAMLSLLSTSRPARRRLASDTLLLDNAIVASYCGPRIWQHAYLDPSLSRATEADQLAMRSELLAIFSPARRALLESPSAWRDHAKGLNSAAASFGANMSSLARQPRCHPALAQAIEDGLTLLGTVRRGGPLGWMPRMPEGELGAARKGAKAEGSVPDPCDACGKGEAGNRCSRCRVARYCTAECQKMAWGGHKVACREPRKLITP
ncbi:hypothetical protein DFJ74DRAFT_739490, partial [Hyaloraphidium curvatum]